MSESYTALAADTLDPARPFTDPGHAAADLGHLREVARCLRAALSVWESAPPTPLTIVRHREPDGRACRVVIARGAALLQAERCAVVGFFGRRRPDADSAAALLDQTDQALLEEFLPHPQILAYCSQERSTEGWGNLVLMSDESAKTQWAASERHWQAATVLAPRYYAWVRIHNGALDGRVRAGGVLRLLRTKYFDYSAGGLWRGLRVLDPPPEVAVV